MTMAALASPPRRKARQPQESPPGIVLYGVSWDTYMALLDDVGDDNVRLTYDDGALEISLPGEEPEKYKKLLGRMIELLSLDRDIPISSYGALTMKKEQAKKGVEPDECYYVQNEPKVRGRIKLDPTTDPPPDLVVEVDIFSHSLKKEPIYAALGVAEVWRFDGSRLLSLHWDAQGRYAPHDTSLAFPFLKMADVERFVLGLAETDEMSVMRLWRDWLRLPARRGKGKRPQG